MAQLLTRLRPNFQAGPACNECIEIKGSRQDDEGGGYSYRGRVRIEKEGVSPGESVKVRGSLSSIGRQQIATKETTQPTNIQTIICANIIKNGRVNA